MLTNKMMRRARIVMVGLAVGAMPLVTAGSCDPVNRAFSFYRNTSGGSDGFFDVFVEPAGGYYYDDYYYDDYYYEEVIYTEDYYYDDYYYEDVAYWP